MIATPRLRDCSAWEPLASTSGSPATRAGSCSRTPRATSSACSHLAPESVRLVLARCSVDYAGRLTAHLPMATRLLMVKADGCVSIHADGGAYKPLNWMSPPCRLDEGDGVWTVSSPKGETLTITIDEVLSDVTHELGVDPGLQKDGV